MPWYQILGIVGSVIGVMSASFALLRYLIVHEVRAVGAELRPNGGSSFRDHVDARLDSQDIRLDRIDKRVLWLEEKVERR